MSDTVAVFKFIFFFYSNLKFLANLFKNIS